MDIIQTSYNDLIKKILYMQHFIALRIAFIQLHISRQVAVRMGDCRRKFEDALREVRTEKKKKDVYTYKKIKIIAELAL